jgi:hypothetical protein
MYICTRLCTIYVRELYIRLIEHPDYQNEVHISAVDDMEVLCFMYYCLIRICISDLVRLCFNLYILLTEYDNYPVTRRALDAKWNIKVIATRLQTVMVLMTTLEYVMLPHYSLEHITLMLNFVMRIISMVVWISYGVYDELNIYAMNHQPDGLQKLLLWSCVY